MTAFVETIIQMATIFNRKIFIYDIQNNFKTQVFQEEFSFIKSFKNLAD